MLVYAFHGLGQLAHDIIAPFLLRPKQDGCTIVAPQAPNKYVRDPARGTEGACWSSPSDTAAHRDAVNHYLDAVADEWEAAGAQVILFGFSQGGLTACRWAAHRTIPPAHIILNSSTIPRSLASRGHLAERITLIAGRRDPLITPELRAETIDRANELTGELKVREFDGGHEVLPAGLDDIWQALLRPTVAVSGRMPPELT